MKFNNSIILNSFITMNASRDRKEIKIDQIKFTSSFDFVWDEASQEMHVENVEVDITPGKDLEKFINKESAKKELEVKKGKLEEKYEKDTGIKKIVDFFKIKRVESKIKQVEKGNDYMIDKVLKKSDLLGDNGKLSLNYDQTFHSFIGFAKDKVEKLVGYRLENEQQQSRGSSSLDYANKPSLFESIKGSFDFGKYDSADVKKVEEARKEEVQVQDSVEVAEEAKEDDIEIDREEKDDKSANSSKDSGFSSRASSNESVDSVGISGYGSEKESNCKSLNQDLVEKAGNGLANSGCTTSDKDLKSTNPKAPHTPAVGDNQDAQVFH